MTAKPWYSYLNGRTVSILFLGFSSGLPLYTLIYLMQAWLAKAGLDVKALGLFGLVTFPYTFKFLWAPLMDRYAIGSLGRRRGSVAGRTPTHLTPPAAISCRSWWLRPGWPAGRALRPFGSVA